MRTLTIPLGIVTLVGVAASVAVACTTSIQFTLPTGGQAVTPYGSCDTVDGYAEISGVTVFTDFCGSLSCPSGTYYALCNGTAWAGCDCTPPSGFTSISWTDFGDASTGGPETGSGGPETGSGGPETGSGSPETGAGETGSGSGSPDASGE
jgi:hypothetical protein